MLESKSSGRPLCLHRYCPSIFHQSLFLIQRFLEQLSQVGMHQ